MAAQTQEVPLLSKRQQILNMIPQFEIKPIFAREAPLDREVVIGTVGDKGAGKSASDAGITLIDGALAGKPVFSNLLLHCDIEIDDDTARKYGLNYGGIAHYKSEPLVKDALLNLDERYRNAYLLIEEINVEYSNARKALTNTNTDFNEVCQQLRKFKTSLIYNVIDEMFIDVQLRALTDIFLKTYDTAYDLDKMAMHKQPGMDFCWTIYPMSAYLRGEQGKYDKVSNNKPLAPVYFHFGALRGIYDSTQHQTHGIYSMSRKDRDKANMLAHVSVESDPELVKVSAKWQWLQEAALDLRNAGQKFMLPHELQHWIGRPLGREEKAWLSTFGVHWDNARKGYAVDDFSINQEAVRPRRELVPA